MKTAPKATEQDIIGYLLIESGTQYEYRAFARTLPEAKKLFMKQWKQQPPPFSEWHTYKAIDDYFGIEVIPLYYGYHDLA